MNKTLISPSFHLLKLFKGHDYSASVICVVEGVESVEVVAHLLKQSLKKSRRKMISIYSQHLKYLKYLLKYMQY